MTPATWVDLWGLIAADLKELLSDPNQSLYATGRSQETLAWLYEQAERRGGWEYGAIEALARLNDEDAGLITQAVSKLSGAHIGNKYGYADLTSMLGTMRTMYGGSFDETVFSKEMLDVLAKNTERMQREYDEGNRLRRWGENNLVMVSALSDATKALVYFELFGCSTALRGAGNTSAPEGSGSNNVPDKANDVVNHVESHNGAPPQGYKGGRTFNNQPINGGQKLPDGVTYREYDVNSYVQG